MGEGGGECAFCDAQVLVADEKIYPRISWMNAMRPLMLWERAWSFFQRERTLRPSQTTEVLIYMLLQLFPCWNSECRQRCGEDILSPHIHGTTTFSTYSRTSSPDIIFRRLLAGCILQGPSSRSASRPPLITYPTNCARLLYISFPCTALASRQRSLWRKHSAKAAFQPALDTRSSWTGIRRRRG